jgi:homoserine dehydrogenase
MRRVGVALLGLGTVGSGVARLLTEHADRLRRRSGLVFELRHVVVRDPERSRDVRLSPGLLTSDVQRVLEDPHVQIVVELWGGLEPARQTCLQLLRAGKDLVTANKALLAEHGPEIFDTADAHQRSVAFEASVAGGIPILGALAHGLSANRILSIRGILNGTSNYILTSMADRGLAYQQALLEAQARGYAEADPSLDVNGTDAAQKLAILVQLAFGYWISPGQISRQGIEQIQQADLRYAAELGYAIKLLAVARLHEDGLEVRVGPTLLRRRQPLAEVRGAYNAVQVEGDAVGDILFYGKGAGQMPTASAVVADLLDTALGRAHITFRMLRMWSGNGQKLRILGPVALRSRFYFRFHVWDRPGVLAQIARVLGDHNVSIASVIQHEPLPGETARDRVPLVLMTHAACEQQVQEAARLIDQLPVVDPPSVCLRVED